MINKASGRSALILTAGLFVLLASPVTAATDGNDSTSDAQTVAPTIHRTYRHASHHRRRYAHRQLHAIAKADTDNDDKKLVAAEAATDNNNNNNKPVPAEAATDNNNKALPDISPTIANANAQMLLAGAQINAAAAIPAGTGATATASDNADADNKTLVVAADQLNDVDRTLQESSTPAPAVSSAPAPAATMTGDSSVWDQTTLIGKIFIGFGALLTMASAARMFIT